MDSKIFEEVKTFISRLCAIQEEKITLDARIMEDLGIAGEDADELMTALAQNFHIDMTGYDFLDYFYEEGGDNPLGQLYYQLFNRNKIRPKLSLTVKDLVVSVQLGKWTVLKEVKPDASRN